MFEAIKQKALAIWDTISKIIPLAQDLIEKIKDLLAKK